MNIKFAALVTTFLLTTGCANGPTNPPQLPNDSSPVAGATSSGSSSAGTQKASAGRTRAEVYGEAVEAVKHYKSTQSEERDFFNPYAR